MQVIAAQDNVLVLRNGAVVAAVGFGSMNDTLLSEVEIEAKLTATAQVPTAAGAKAFAAAIAAQRAQVANIAKALDIKPKQ